MENIEQRLEQIDLSQYADLFAENDIDCEVLSEPTEQDLKDLGISLGLRLYFSNCSPAYHLTQKKEG